ncbi:hypothetical protein ABZ404_38640 [Streptomyces sp. NPDC005878]|uniref:putative phage holin n=1 Tax=Streptomyces sp. NPDC005878 TaxID=3157077 RepID=UPI0033DB0042
MDCSQIANVAASGVVTLSSAVFCAAYQRLAPWRASAVGRHIMAFTGAIGALALYSVIVGLWPTGPHIAFLRGARTLLLVVIAALIIQRTCMLFHAQHAHANDPQDDTPPTKDPGGTVR